MSQTKAQLIQPIGVVTASGIVVSGVVTASSFDGDVVGTATSIISGGNLNLGDVNATTFQEILREMPQELIQELI